MSDNGSMYICCKVPSSYVAEGTFGGRTLERSYISVPIAITASKGLAVAKRARRAFVLAQYRICMRSATAPRRPVARDSTATASCRPLDNLTPRGSTSCPFDMKPDARPCGVPDQLAGESESGTG